MLQPTRRGSMKICSCSPMGTRLGEPMTASFRPFLNGHAMACSSLPPYYPTVCMTSSGRSLREAAIYVLFPPLSLKKINSLSLVQHLLIISKHSPTPLRFVPLHHFSSNPTLISLPPNPNQTISTVHAARTVLHVQPF